MKLQIYLFVGLFILCGQINADTPADCRLNDILGEWEFKETDPNGDSKEECSKKNNYTHRIQLKLEYPNKVTDYLGRTGTFTLIYNQGFSVEINYRKYFAFSAYETNRLNQTTSYCHKTLPGWSHDVLGKNWACYVGNKVKSNENEKSGKINPIQSLNLKSSFDPVVEFSSKRVLEFNSRPNGWKAAYYPEFQKMSVEDLIKMAGGRASMIHHRPEPAKLDPEISKLVKQLPESFDWRDVNGENYVSPVRNQGSCGSCYAFATLSMLESRLRIATNNTEKKVLSPQQIIDCSKYSQGCEGGFAFLVSKYGQDFGIVEENCYSYMATTRECHEKCKDRTYTYQFQYVGGYYGGSNAENMQLELVKNGPISVGFQVFSDFFSYSHGVYSHESSSDAHPDPFYSVNHAVLIVGYGVDKETNKKYWMVKNSWGKNWGLDGYFMIERGTNNCGIESIGLVATPIPKL